MQYADPRKLGETSRMMMSAARNSPLMRASHSSPGLICQSSKWTSCPVCSRPPRCFRTASRHVTSSCEYERKTRTAMRRCSHPGLHQASGRARPQGTRERSLAPSRRIAYLCHLERLTPEERSSMLRDERARSARTNPTGAVASIENTRTNPATVRPNEPDKRSPKRTQEADRLRFPKAYRLPASANDDEGGPNEPEPPPDGEGLLAGTATSSGTAATRRPGTGSCA